MDPFHLYYKDPAFTRIYWFTSRLYQFTSLLNFRHWSAAARHFLFFFPYNQTGAGSALRGGKTCGFCIFTRHRRLAPGGTAWLFD